MSQPKPLVGQQLLSARDRGIIEHGAIFLRFINLVEVEAIPEEVEALPPVFQRELEDYVAGLGIGGPGWEYFYFSTFIGRFENITPEEVEERYQGIARKNRVTAEALLRYFHQRVSCPTTSSKFPPP